MKIIDELKGKEVIDANGNKVGKMSDANWNPKSNRVEYIIVTPNGTSAKIRPGKKLVISYEDINLIGDKILLKA